MTILYGLLVIGLAFGLYAQWWLYPIATPDLNKPLSTQAAPEDANFNSQIITNSSSLHSKRTYSRIAQRPLFSVTRRPAEIEVVEEPTASTPVEEPKPPVEEQRLDGLMLTAIIVKGTEHIALMKDPQIDKTLRLLKGGSIRGWNVTDVGQESISLLSPNGTSSELKLRIFRPPIGPAAAPPPPQIPPPDANIPPPELMPPGGMPPRFDRRRRSRRPPTL